MNIPEHTTLEFLASAPMSPRPVQHGSTADEVIKNSRIAIIDDEPTNVEAVREHLRMAGYQQFFTTTDSTKAMDLIREERPDVILLDIMMPHVSGLDILDELRESVDLCDLPVIVLTAATDREMKLKVLESGATEFLTKPLDSVELLVRLKNVLRMKTHLDRVKDYIRELKDGVEAIRQERADEDRQKAETLHGEVDSVINGIADDLKKLLQATQETKDATQREIKALQERAEAEGMRQAEEVKKQQLVTEADRQRAETLHGKVDSVLDIMAGDIKKVLQATQETKEATQREMKALQERAEAERKRQAEEAEKQRILAEEGSQKAETLQGKVDSVLDIVAGDVKKVLQAT